MNYYLSIGLGVWLMAKIVDTANPLLDVAPLMEVALFLGTLFLWPLSLLGNLLHSLEDRKTMKAEIVAAEVYFKKLIDDAERSLDEPQGSESNEQGSDKGGA